MVDGGVDGQAADVADVGHVAVQLERLDEALPGLVPPLMMKAMMEPAPPSGMYFLARSCHGLTTGRPG